MKKFYSLLSIFVVVIAMTGCSSNPKAQGQGDFRCKQDGQLAPTWTCTPQSTDDMIVGLGSAPKSQAGMNFTRVNAMAQARNDLAFQIETQVKAKVENFVRATGVKSNESVDAVSTQVSKQLAQVDLKGTKQIKSWQNPANGTLYVLVGTPRSSVNAVVKKTITQSSYNNNNALWQQFQSKNALEQLDKDFPTK